MLSSKEDLGRKWDPPPCRTKREEQALESSQALSEKRGRWSGTTVGLEFQLGPEVSSGIRNFAEE